MTTSTQCKPYAKLGPLTVLLVATYSGAFAGSATWKTNPVSGNWNRAVNWIPATVPNGAADAATFESSNRTDVSVRADTEVDKIVFNPGASAFTISPVTTVLSLSGTGVSNASGIVQRFMTGAGGSGNSGGILFSNSATVGGQTVFRSKRGGVSFENASNAGSGTFINEGGTVSGTGGGSIIFFDTASADNGIFINKGGEVSGAEGGFIEFSGVQFRGSSTAANATFTNEGGAVSGAKGGRINLFASASGGNATFINNGGTVSGAGGGVTLITVLAKADNATLIANGSSGGGEGGSIQFAARTRGGARVEVFGNGNLDISSHFYAGLAIGSLEGDGNVFLGLIQDGGVGGGIGGSITKIGKGKLTLTGENTYTGGTTVTGGTLLVSSKNGSGTGSGDVQVTGGTLGGKGVIAGAVTVGTGSDSGATLSPGTNAHKLGTLTINSMLTFNSLSAYECVLKRSTARVSRTTALGVTIDSNVTFTFIDIGTATLAKGTVFNVINNTSASPIAGTFNNLPDGSTFTSNGNKYKANYQGGDGNDLKLTVVQ